MPNLRTEITEIVTGLGMSGAEDLDDALAARPDILRNVLPVHWGRLAAARAAGTHQTDFDAAWANGRAFLEANDGLRGRLPVSIEWKGPQNPPGFDFLPADLRTDHVFLVSCKYLSKVLANSSPANLFDRCLADRSTSEADHGWYGLMSPNGFADFYSEVRAHMGPATLPALVNNLTAAHIALIRGECAGTWPEPLREPWKAFSALVADASAERWNDVLTTKRRREDMLWRLLRLNPAPYFVLGSSSVGPMRLRIGTPWDWRQHFSLKEFEVLSVPGAGQPKVGWKAVVLDKASDTDRTVEGHVEVRWSHGRFSAVEAKVYLDTPHDDVPGYFGLL